MIEMNTAESLNRYFSSWQTLDCQSADALRSIVKDNPDSLQARMLLIYNLYKINSDDFAAELENAVSAMVGSDAGAVGAGAVPGAGAVAGAGADRPKTRRASTGDYMKAFFDADTDSDNPIFDISKLKADLEKPEEPSVPKYQEKKQETIFCSEPLAHIYIKQQKYDKALEIIRALSLNNPQKSCYFADQIRFLEEIIFVKQKNNK